MKYCTIIADEKTRIKFINIAKAMNLRVYWMTECNSINEAHIKKYKTHYYLILRDDEVSWKIDHLYMSEGKEISNEKFIQKMFLSSL